MRDVATVDTVGKCVRKLFFGVLFLKNALQLCIPCPKVKPCPLLDCTHAMLGEWAECLGLKPCKVGQFEAWNTLAADSVINAQLPWDDHVHALQRGWEPARRLPAK